MKGNFDIIILSRDNHKNKFLVLNHDIEHLNFTFFLPHSLHFFLSCPCPSFSLTFLFSFFPSSASLLLPSPFVLFKFLCVCVCVCVHVCTCACSVIFNTLWPHELQHTRLLCPRDFPGKNAWVGCHFLLQEIFSGCLANYSFFLLELLSH